VQTTLMIKSVPGARLVAILQALLVISLWSSSWVLIKWGLRDLPPLTFAGLRYFLAFLVLVPFASSRSNRVALRSLGRRSFVDLVILGLLLYALAVGAQFVALWYLPAVTTRLILSFNTVTVALLSGVLLRERPTRLQWYGVLIALLGAYLYFHPVDVTMRQLQGIGVALVAMLTFSLASVQGRNIARSKTISPLLVTAVSMGVGSTVLLISAALSQGIPNISPTNWLIILWLSVVNTSFTFVLWNRTLRTLSAVESSIISNAMIIEIAVLAWVFLGERLTVVDGVGLGLVILGAVTVQLRGR
jgi:drug/metabolite transporter (DMT)-like permease